MTQTVARLADDDLATAILQRDEGPIPGDAYLPAAPGNVRWGRLPCRADAPVLTVSPGTSVTIDTVSHEGILEDQGRAPVSWLGGHGVRRREILTDAIDIAAHYGRTARNFDLDGPHVVTGPIRVEGARPGDVLKVVTLDLRARVPYGVVSSRHGKGALAITATGAAPAGITLDEVMPPHATDNRSSGIPTEYHNVSVFTALRDGHGVMASGRRSLRFPVNPFFGMIGVAFSGRPGSPTRARTRFRRRSAAATSTSGIWAPAPPS